MHKNNGRYNRLGLEKVNNQNSVMKIIEYNNAHDITVEFKDEYKSKVHAQWNNFVKGNIKNPYAPSVLGVGALGLKYPTTKDGKNIKEYELWYGMLERCFSEDFKNRYSTYTNVTCCEEWLLFENFYEWIHEQPNYCKCINENGWNVDKDILLKGNKIYSPETCCLVPWRINILFTKSDVARGKYPIGVTYYKPTNKYQARLSKVGIKGKYRKTLGYADTPEEAFQTYKKAKELYIKQVAQEEYNKGNITKQCYDAMMNYEVEITD